MSGRAALALLSILASSLVFPACEKEEKTLKLAVVTTVRDSGLLERVVRPFEKKKKVKVWVTAVDTRNALALAEAGAVDALILPISDRLAEFSAERKVGDIVRLFEDPFVVVGPADDPARIRGRNPSAALRAISQRGAAFVSCRSQSEPGECEARLWEKVGGPVRWRARLESDLDTLAALYEADKRKAYVIVDEATFRRHASRVHLVPLVEGDPDLENSVAFTVVEPAHKLALALAEAMREIDSNR